MSEHPYIYQMRLTSDPALTRAKGAFGWIFPGEEDEASDDQVVVHTIASNGNERQGKYLFPGLEGEDERYREFEASRQGHELVVDIEGFKIRFSDASLLPSDDLAPGLPPLLSHFLKEPPPYVGRERELVPPDSRFVPLYPLDTIAMDEIYTRYRVVLVGLTPRFRGNI
ncbi:MAG: hypothetical protein L0177_02315 [Chloroflexi bacterium]|nr:hypothetical protein [Chloroflexota bacterium]